VGTYLREKHGERSIDLIVVNGLRALELVLRLRATLWSGVPVVFSTIDEAAAARLKLPSDVTGTVLRRTLAYGLTTARALVPQLKRIALVGDPPERQRFQRPYLKEFPAFAAQLELIDLTGLPMSDLIARVSALPPDTAIIYEGIWSGETAADNTSEVALATIAAVANRPIVVDTEVWFGFGAAGGFLARPALNGEVAAQLAVRILNGESAANIPVAMGDVNRPVFDWRQLKRFGVSEARLPPGSEVRYRELTPWEQYRWQIIVIAAVLLIQTALIVQLFYERRNRRGAEAMSRSAMGMSASIAHEINQPLAAIVTNANAGLRWLMNKTPDLDEARAAFKRVASDGHRAGEVIESVRMMFKKESGEVASIDLNDLIQNVLRLLHGELQRKGIVVQTDLTRPLPLVLGHAANCSRLS
jgi:signal transduction histidine kinase